MHEDENYNNDEESKIIKDFLRECSLSPSPEIPIEDKTLVLDPEQDALKKISKISLTLFNDLDNWKLVHYSRVANWILERIKSDNVLPLDHCWNCVVGESGSFHFCVTSEKMYDFTFNQIRVILFTTNQTSDLLN